MKPVKIYRSGLVRRWHQNPEMSQFNQNNAAHQWSCAMLLLILHPDPPMNLLVYVLTHDVGEIDAGDLANPSKNRNSELTRMLNEFETHSRHKTLGEKLSPVISSDEKEWFWLVDKLEAILFMLTFQPQLQGSRGWPGQIQAVTKKAEELGCFESVIELIGGVTRDD